MESRWQALRRYDLWGIVGTIRIHMMVSMADVDVDKDIAGMIIRIIMEEEILAEVVAEVLFS